MSRAASVSASQVSYIFHMRMLGDDTHEFSAACCIQPLQRSSHIPLAVVHILFFKLLPQEQLPQPDEEMSKTTRPD